jgi:6-pyruvoyltetrahydropterin/6-carboxytetrahydropterin synthase
VTRATRRYRFSASHRLHAPQLGAEENRRLYGKCNNPYGHGHDYELEVTVAGPLDERSGRVVDPRALDALVSGQVLARYAHRNLNAECEEFRTLVPTSENLAREIARRLKRHWGAAFPDGGPRLEKICIAETPRNIFQIDAGEIE